MNGGETVYPNTKLNVSCSEAKQVKELSDGKHGDKMGCTANRQQEGKERRTEVRKRGRNGERER